MKFFARIAEKIRKATEDYGYVCDNCGAEIFSYPVHRLCESAKKICRESAISFVKSAAGNVSPTGYVSIVKPARPNLKRA